jgi:MFS family permease
MRDEAEPSRASDRFLWLFAIAWAGAAIAYVPFLTVLMPLRIVSIVGDDSVRIVGLITFAGAVAASCGNVLFGWLSDRTGTRKPWVACGLALSSIMLVSISMLHDWRSILLVVICWQLSLNMMLGPLWAWAADRVPRNRTGLLGGLMSLAPSAGALTGVLVTTPGLAGPDARLWLVAFIVCVCVLPALLFIRPVARDSSAVEGESGRLSAVRFVATMWMARLLLQIAEAALFAYLLLYFLSLDPSIAESWVARVFGGVLIGALPIAIAAGKWADRSTRPARPLAVLSLVSAAGLVALAASSTPAQASLAYMGFGLATTAFLSLHSGQTLRVLPSPQHRGRDLGLFNLTNTIPSLIMPWLTISLVPAHGFSTLFLMLAGLALCSAAMLFGLKGLD